MILNITSLFLQRQIADGWTMVGNNGFMAQHEHTIVVTDGAPMILAEMNEIWN